MLIIVSGLPGSGKSFLARRLSGELGAEYINSDATRRTMNAMGRYAFEDKLDVYEKMANKAGEKLREGKTVIVDATFYHHEMRDIFVTLGTLLHKPISYIEVQADEKIIQERLSKPRSDSEADFAVYQQLKLQYEDPGRPRLVLESTNDSIDTMVGQALDYIKGINEGDTG
jgi:hypothetical protein